MKVRFYKAESAGNDFILILAGTLPPLDLRSAIPRWCHRRKGIGADGVIFLNLETKPFGFRIFNADGSEAEISGNGLMCAAALLFHFQPDGTDKILFRTMNGVHTVFRKSDEHFAVELGPLPTRSDFQSFTVHLDDSDYEFHYTRFPGNPHAIYLADSPERLSADFLLIAPRVETLSQFPNRTNVEFVDLSPNSFAQVRVWERGVGETLACGSGAAAISALLFHLAKTAFPVELRFPGGSLFGDVRDGRVFVGSQVHLVFEGELCE